MKPLLCVPVLLSVKTNVKNIQVMLLALRKTYLWKDETVIKSQWELKVAIIISSYGSNSADWAN